MPEHTDEPTGAELAAIEAELPEWERLAVEEFWAAVIEEELEAARPEATSYRWSPQGPGERRREHRAHRRTGRTVLRLAVQSVESTEFADGDVAGGAAA